MIGTLNFMSGLLARHGIAENIFISDILPQWLRYLSEIYPMEVWLKTKTSGHSLKLMVQLPNVRSLKIMGEYTSLLFNRIYRIMFIFQI